MTLYLWFPFWPCCAQRLGSHCSRKLVGSCQALPWHTGAQQLPLGESYSLPKPVPRSVVWQPSQPRGCHLAQQVLETPAEKIAAIRLWTVTSHPNKGTPGPWVLGQGRASNLANLREEEGQGRGARSPGAAPRASASLRFPICKTGGWARFPLHSAGYPTCTVWKCCFQSYVYNSGRQGMLTWGEVVRVGGPLDSRVPGTGHLLDWLGFEAPTSFGSCGPWGLAFMFQGFFQLKASSPWSVSGLEQTQTVKGTDCPSKGGTCPGPQQEPCLPHLALPASSAPPLY